MNCPLQQEKNPAVLLDYSAGRLAPDKAAAFERHMKICPDCAGIGMEQKAVWDALGSWEAGPVNADFNRRLWQRIDAANAAPWYRQLARSLRFTSWKPAVPLAAAVLMVAAGFVLDHSASRTSVRGTPAADSVSVGDANRVEQTLEDIQLLHQFDSTTAQSGGSPKQM
jgi:anti-sigma factor RsiW